MLFHFFAWFVAAQYVLANPISRAKSSLFNKRGNTKEKFLVLGLPGLTENLDAKDVPLMFAGQLELYKENNTHFFFWRFSDQNKRLEAQNRTIFWLNGGPGCSSMDGALMEAGPLRINDDHKVEYNNGSWHKKADVVFVDQPAGTGFSYTDKYDSELVDIRRDFLRFLEKYFEVFPEDRNNEITLAGESYAGQYIPYIALGILKYNKEHSENPYRLKGLLIGNGWINPNVQSLSYLPFAVQAGIISTSHPKWQEVLDQHVKCQDLVAGAKEDETFGANRVVDTQCENVLNVLLLVTRDHQAQQSQQCYNMYDYTLKDSFPSCGMNWPPDLKDVNPFLRQELVMASLNIEHLIKWHECDLAVSSHLRARHSKPSIVLFPELLREIPIVLFHGNRDIICNYIGGEKLIEGLKWGGKRGFTDKAVEYDWLYDGHVLGTVRSERNLTFVNVHDASHMVPFDKPEASRALIDILYERTDIDEEAGKKPKLLTHPLNYKEPTLTGPETGASLGALSVPSLGMELDSSNTTSTAQDSASSESQESHTSRTVRLIQLAVIVVLVWGVCALYNTYKLKPTSIIKTKPSGRKKNVQWADQLEEDDQEESPSGGFILKALHKLKGKDGYATVPNDIELEDVAQDDDFIIASDDESAKP